MISVSKPTLTHKKRVQGFTLIELLIVMTLVGLAVSIVGPSLYKQYDKARTLQQRQKVEFSLKYLAQVAFYNQKTIVVSFNGSEVSAKFREQDHQELARESSGEEHFDSSDSEVPLSDSQQAEVGIFTESFPGLFFKPQAVDIDVNGIAEVSTISVFQNELEQPIRFHHVIKKTVGNDAD